MFDRQHRTNFARKMPTGEHKPRLPMLVVPKFRVHYKDLEKFITAVFGFEFDFMFAAGVTNKTGVDYTVTGEMPTRSWDQKAEELRTGRRSRNIPLILAVLAKDQYIPIGYYTIIT